MRKVFTIHFHGLWFSKDESKTTFNAVAYTNKEFSSIDFEIVFDSLEMIRQQKKINVL